MSSSGKRSAVWQFFKLTSDNKFVKCNLCQKQYKFLKNTTNLNQHLKRLHPSYLLPPHNHDDTDEDIKLQEAKPSTSAPTASTSAATPSTSTAGPSTSCSDTPASTRESQPSKRQRQLRLFGSTRSNTELSEAENASLNEALVKMIVADYQPLRIVEDIGFRQFVAKLNPLYKIPSRKMLTTQLLPQLYWKEVDILRQKLSSAQFVAVTTDLWTSDSTKHYITVTIHFVTNGILHASALQTNEVKGTQTGEQIALELSEIFNKWDISDKIVTVVSDNGANVKSAIHDHLQKHNHPCIAHTLNLSVHETIMLQCLVDIKIPLVAVTSGLPNAPPMLNADEWMIVEECMKVLKIVDLMTTALSGEKFVTLSSIIPLVRGVQHSINAIDCATAVGDQLKNDILNVLSRRLGSYEKDKISSKDTFLDPRYKKIGFGTQENAENAEKWILAELEGVIATSLPASTESSTPVPETENNPDKVNMLWSHFDSKMARTTRALDVSAKAQAIQMVKQYLSMANVFQTLIGGDLC